MCILDKQMCAVCTEIKPAMLIFQTTPPDTRSPTATNSSSSSSSLLRPETVIDGRYTHAEYVEGHLELMKFLLKEGDLYLRWQRCKVLWDTLVANKDAIDFDGDTCFAWFETCLPDLQQDTQQDFFQVLKTTLLNEHLLACFYRI